jgi:phosphate transport system substrate-binding protein
VLIFRPASSGTRSTFKKLVLGGATEATGGQTLTEDSNGAVTTAVTKTNGAVSVIGFAYYNDPANKPSSTASSSTASMPLSPTWPAAPTSSPPTATCTPTASPRA